MFDKGNCYPLDRAFYYISNSPTYDGHEVEFIDPKCNTSIEIVVIIRLKVGFYNLELYL